ncbi:hypothetical protein PTSG_01016 [Salpingoeca rosetta]|uniref:GATA-type domain-containing protein n=1 Tax=Salpingoeca rosetta (strain ATCC 50818 / BSB-021) TaxID=946362 RepID=F2TY54_SALR5|nr:uncharacterized protein PTSG_01016 [Salpingoeca rosetta]EGD76313.1 hypothetical protein PTSG_01016 [Salpingoeca rosetta]|eukprot:XP_004998488.1 hypothetical protein PTSG_01016 [Salpingoeca rosetta]
MSYLPTTMTAGSSAKHTMMRGMSTSQQHKHAPTSRPTSPASVGSTDSADSAHSDADQGDMPHKEPNNTNNMRCRRFMDLFGVFDVDVLSMDVYPRDEVAFHTMHTSYALSMDTSGDNEHHHPTKRSCADLAHARLFGRRTSVPLTQGPSYTSPGCVRELAGNNNNSSTPHLQQLPQQQQQRHHEQSRLALAELTVLAQEHSLLCKAPQGTTQHNDTLHAISRLQAIRQQEQQQRKKSTRFAGYSYSSSFGAVASVHHTTLRHLGRQRQLDEHVIPASLVPVPCGRPLNMPTTPPQSNAAAATRLGYQQDPQQQQHQHPHEGHVVSRGKGVRGVGRQRSDSTASTASTFSSASVASDASMSASSSPASSPSVSNSTSPSPGAMAKGKSAKRAKVAKLRAREPKRVPSSSHHHTHHKRSRSSKPVSPARGKRTLKHRSRSSSSSSSSSSCSSSSSSSPSIARVRPLMVDPSGNGCICCGITSTPMWRDGPNDARLCNACGIRWQKYGVHCTKCSYIPRKIEKAKGFCPRCKTTLPPPVATRRRLNGKVY